MAYYPVSQETWNKFKMRVTSPYGMRKDPITGKPGNMHSGIDIAPGVITNENKIIIASQYGILRQLRDPYGANYSIVQGRDGLEYMSVHHQSFLRGDGPVRAGEPIAIMGKTGRATGVHTHFAVKRMGTKTWLDPQKQALTFYVNYNIMDDVYKWNHSVGSKITADGRPFTSEIVKIVGEGNPSKIANIVGDPKRDMLLQKLYELNEWMDKNGLSNNAEADRMIARYALYKYNSIDR